MGIVEGIVYGIVGGSLVEVLKWWHIREEIQEKGLPNWSKSKPYWIITFLMIAAGGIMVFIYMESGTTLNPVVAVHLGAATPLIISGIVRQVPVSPGKVD